MRALVVLCAIALTGCASGTDLPPPQAKAAGTPAAAVQTKPRACPTVPAHVRAAASANLALPNAMERRGTLAGEALVSDIEKTQALRDLIALYERCRR